MVHSLARSIRRDRILPRSWLIAAAAAALCYFGVWNGYFQYDDFWHLGGVRFQTFVGALRHQWGYSVRPLLDVVLWVEVRLFAANAAPYLWLSLGQHVLVTLGVWWLVGRWSGDDRLALLASLLFGVNSAYYLVVSYISESQYSLGAVIYLAAVGLLTLYLQQRRLVYYLGSLALFVAGLLYKELLMTLPLALVACHLILGWSGNFHGPPVRPGWRELLKLHAPYWLILAAYLPVQLAFFGSGTSEAAGTSQDYAFGLHALGQFLNLIFLLIPNVQNPATYNFLMPLAGAGVLAALVNATTALALVGAGLAVWGFWKGPPLVRLALAWMCLTYAPYTLWAGSLAQAVRYLYLPGVGFALLAAWLLVRAQDWLRRRSGLAAQYGLALLVGLFLAGHVMTNQVWLRRNNENGQMRAAFVAQLVRDFSLVEPGSSIYMEVPEDKFVDLRLACVFVIKQAVTCLAFPYGEQTLAQVLESRPGAKIYWLKVKDRGFDFVYPI